MYVVTVNGVRIECETPDEALALANHARMKDELRRDLAQLESAAADNGGNGETPHTGLRAAIRSVLSETGHGMKPSQVTNLLHVRGFAGDKGLEWLKLRVSQEMNRMYNRQHSLKRLPGGRYRLPAGDVPSGDG